MRRSPTRISKATEFFSGAALLASACAGYSGDETTTNDGPGTYDEVEGGPLVATSNAADGEDDTLLGAAGSDARGGGVPSGPDETSPREANRSPLLVNVSTQHYHGEELMFVDLVKAAELWRRDWDERGQYPDSQIELDEHGWIQRLNLPAGSQARTLIGRTAKTGEYLVRWAGKGRFRLAQDGETELSVEATGPGSTTWRVNASGTPRLEIDAVDSSDHLRDISIVHSSLVQTADDQPFYRETLDYLRDFAGLRFMDFTLTNNSPQVTWRDRPDSEFFTQSGKGGSYEYAIRLCNTIRRDGWFNVPHRADDDYVRSLATLLRDRMDPELKIYIEYSNETWNGMFDQSDYIWRTGAAVGTPGDDDYLKGFRWHGVRSVEIFEIFEQVFGREAMGERVVRVIAGQASNPWLAEQHLDFDDHAASTDAYAVAPYFGAGAGNANRDWGGFADLARGWDLDQLFTYLREVDLPATRAAMETMAEVVQRRGVRLIAYEGGQHLAGSGEFLEDEALAKLYMNANRDPRMGELYRAYLDEWRAAGGEEFTLYLWLGEYSKFGSWGLKEGLLQPASASPKYAAALDWASANQRWW